MPNLAYMVQYNYMEICLILQKLIIKVMNGILTTGILLTMIGCFTCVVLAMIGVLYTRVKTDDDKHRRWTYAYSSSIIVFIAITIFSYIFHGSNKVLDFMSLASSIISIILAVITIIYSFYSNNRASNQVGKLDEAINKVDKSVDKVDEAAVKVENATLKYANSAQILHNNIEKILDKLGKVEEKTNYMYELQQNSNILQQVDEPKLINGFVERYIRIGSYLGNIALLACVYSHETQKELTSQMLDSIESNMSQYMYGYIIASSAVGVLQARIDDPKVTVSFVSPSLKNNLITTISQHIQQSPNEKYRLYNQELYDRLNRLFEKK